MTVKQLRICISSLFLLAVLSTPLLAGWTTTIISSQSGWMRLSLSGVSGGQQVGTVHPYTTLGYYINYHASVWNGTTESRTDLHPAGHSSSHGYATSGAQQAGWCDGHAALWSGTAASYVDLHPAGSQYRGSWANGISGGQQAGQVLRTVSGWSTHHAGLWTGTAESFVDLSPDAENASALGVQDGQQVGFADGHAALWSGTAASKVDLNPANCTESRAHAVGDGQQVGEAHVIVGSHEEEPGLIMYDTQTRASLWTGTAQSWVDLNPAGCTSSYAYGVLGGRQVGSARGSATGDESHASLWSGTAASWTDLHALLPAGYTSSSAVGIDVSGGIVNVVGSARPTGASESIGVIWSFAPDAVPEPSSLLALGSGLVGLCGFLRRRK